MAETSGRAVLTLLGEESSIADVAIRDGVETLSLQY